MTSELSTTGKRGSRVGAVHKNDGRQADDEEAEGRRGLGGGVEEKERKRARKRLCLPTPSPREG